MQRKVAQAGNTMVPAVLAMEAAGFRVTEAGAITTDGTDTYVADDPVALLGLVKLIEMRGRAWQASDDELDAN
ncbi:hypothetical protein [Nocardia asiatica]|uniref:hypothetical protein n=1 Tax=Nocardia asiatica TaxID=209252 RepID=UPI002457FE64|nr:hypothetical protein [Nocardia asiatica]